MKVIVVAVLIILDALAPLTASAQCWHDEWSVPNSNYLWDVDFVNGSTGWAVRYLGAFWGESILHTTDGGATWAVQDNGHTHALYCVDFVDENYGWAGGYHSLYRTTNGGATWTFQWFETDDYYGIAFADQANGWTVGYQTSGIVKHTTDGGITWVSQSPGPGVTDLKDVACANASTAWAVGYNGWIIRTTNGGTTWNPQTSGTTQLLNGVAFTDATHGWAVGGGGTIRYTTNGGAAWMAQASGTTAALYDVCFSGTEGWATGDSSVVLHTTNGGTTWVREVSSTTTYPDLVGVACWEGQAWAVGSGLGTSVVKTNLCSAPQNLVTVFTPGYWLGWIWIPAVLDLFWTPVAAPGSVTYTIYDDALVNGPYLNFVGSTTDSNYSIYGAGDELRRFYIVKAGTP